MSSLSNKSDKEISDLLDDYGIKHGPIVGSTRGLYEKKLREAMAKNSKPLSSDKTYYREEAEEVEYITYHAPTRLEGYGDVTRRTVARDYTDHTDSAGDHKYDPIIRPTHVTYQSASRTTSAPPKTISRKTDTNSAKSGGFPGWLQILVFLVIAVFLYYVYSTMEPAEENPFNEISA
ncbi:emerin (Emery-Dreifuss muscular dystrophy) [Chanos chanos]|uniref:Emerin (Emery-Dreifuss muscular dystrophy) n=1 Tax=Chanos chanos TaxID=29144 RepID=A0A6J2UZZ3_CHACN|nr:emerin [Chanos chanos]